MRRVLLLVLIAACGSDNNHRLQDGGGADSAHADSARPDATHDGPRTSDATPDGPTCTADHCCTPADCTGSGSGSGATFTCEEHACVDVAGSASGLLWILPCTSAHSSTSCDTSPTVTATTTVGGHAGTTYDIAVHLRGVIEQRTYATSCADGMAVRGGATSASDPFNIYELDISAPPQRLFVNPGTSAINLTFPLDYTLTFRADAGATLTLRADSIDAGEIFNHDGSGVPVSVAGTSVTQPFDGQFIQMDVDSVTVDPIASAATIGAGSAGNALQYSGGQVVTVPTSASLQPVDVTTEAWFQATGLPGTYNAIFSKLLGTGTAESYTIWFQDGSLRSGVDLDSVNGSTADPLNPVDGQWHHVASSSDHVTGLTTLYLDGAAVACSIGATSISYDTQSLLIGGDVDNGQPNGFWQGFLDEVRVFSTVRTADQVWADMHAHRLGPTAGLVGEWTFDEGSGETSADSSGSGNSAFLGSTSAVEGNDPAWVVSTVPH